MPSALAIMRRATASVFSGRLDGLELRPPPLPDVEEGGPSKEEGGKPNALGLLLSAVGEKGVRPSLLLAARGERGVGGGAEVPA